MYAMEVRVLIIALILLIFSLMQIISCTKEDVPMNCNVKVIPNEQNDPEFKDYFSNRKKWECFALERFSFTHIEKNQICFGRITKITIDNNLIIDTVVLNEGIMPFLCSVYSIEDLFNIIEEAVVENIEIEFLRELKGEPIYRALSIDVNYNLEYGFPMKGKIDYIGGLADDEFEFELTDFSL
jgi:hypothetical protein